METGAQSLARDHGESLYRHLSLRKEEFMVQPYFDPLNIGGEVFEFPHLEPFTLEFQSQIAKKWLRVRVTFSHHCFSKRYEAAEHIEGEPILNENTSDPRLFCRIRYRLSQDLPALIASLNNPKTKVWQTSAKRNWAYSIRIEDPAGPYHVFFEVRRASNDQKHLQDINLVVESAYYEKPDKGPPILLGSMSFLLLCGKVFTRQPVATQR